MVSLVSLSCGPISYVGLASESSEFGAFKYTEADKWGHLVGLHTMCKFKGPRSVGLTRGANYKICSFLK
jgi:hypothetical protein